MPTYIDSWKTGSGASCTVRCVSHRREYQIVRAEERRWVSGGVTERPAQMAHSNLDPTVTQRLPPSTRVFPGGHAVPCTTNVNARRARVAALARFRDSADPDLAEARLRLDEERFVAAVERALNIAPPLRPEVRDRILLLLTAGPAA